MTDDGEEMVAFRLAPADRAAIARLVEMGEFRNRSDFFRHAVKTALREYALPKPKLDLELEGVELPESGEPHARRSSRSAMKRGRSP